MAMRFCDSFDHYTDLNQKYTFHANDSIGTGRNGTSGLNAIFTNAGVTKHIDDQATWIIGFALYITSYVNQFIIRWVDGANGTQISVHLRAGTGKLFVLRGESTQLGSDGPTSVPLNAWTYVQLKITVHNSTGVVHLLLDGVDQVNLTGQDTQHTANATANQFQLMLGSAGNWNWLIDDLYVCDGTGATNNDFLGDVRVEARFPNGNGNSSQLDGSDGNTVDNYLLVDETVPNSDTDYVESSDVGDKDTYAFQDLTSTSGTVYGVQIVPWVRKTNAGVKKIVSVARLSATETDSAEKTLSTSYQYLPDIRETKPGGGAWSVSDVNSAEFGAKVST